ncbi:MAG: Dabb family protein, partial [Planctomycetes bacterium]|nr:Dabb family protein [Planctomycetota bacterium]
GLISSFEDEDAFKRYCVYPEHDAVVAYIQSVTVAEEIVDYIL